MSSEPQLNIPVVTEPLLTVAQISKAWQLSLDTVRDLFEREPGVPVLSRPRRGIRRYTTLRIPASVAQRVYNRLAVAAQRKYLVARLYTRLYKRSTPAEPSDPQPGRPTGRIAVCGKPENCWRGAAACLTASSPRYLVWPQISGPPLLSVCGMAG